MIPASFEYDVAESPEHAIELLGRYGEEAKLLAGGQSLLNFMKLRFARPSALVDIGRISELDYVRDDGDSVAIGAVTSYEDAHRNRLLVEHCPLVPMPRVRSATRRCVTWGRSEARSHTAIPPPTCPPSYWRSTPRS